MPGSALVVGGGVMGLSAAWALARAGWRVRLLDQVALPNRNGSSHDQHRLIRHAYGAEAGYMAMVDPAFTAWEQLWAELGESLYVPTGVLAMAAASAGGAQGWLASSRAALRAAGHAVQDLAPAELPGRYPMLSAAGLTDAFHTVPGGVLLADRILAGLERRCRALGVAVEAGAASQVLEVQPEQGRVLTSAGWQQAEVVVVAAGIWVGRLLPGLAPRVTPSRQVIVRLRPPAGLRAAWQAAPMLLDLAEEGGFYAVPPVAGTDLKIGDHRFSRSGDPDASREASAAEVQAILDLAAARLPGLAQYELRGARACYYDVTADERFILAPLGARGWVMSGFSGHGFKFAALLGLALARAAANPAVAALVPAWAAGMAPPPPGLLSSGA